MSYAPVCNGANCFRASLVATLIVYAQKKKILNLEMMVIFLIKEDLSEEGMSWDELEELTKKCNILYLRGV